MILQTKSSLPRAIKDYIRFYAEERLQNRLLFQTPQEVRPATFITDTPMKYPIPENKRIKKYKGKWCA